MANTDLAKISELPNTAKALSWAAIALAIIGCGLSISTDFFPYEIGVFTLIASVIFLLSAFIPWYLAGNYLIPAYHDLWKTSFEISLRILSGSVDNQTLNTLHQFQVSHPVLKDLVSMFVKYFGLHARNFYTLDFIGFLNIVFYALTKMLKMIGGTPIPIPLQPFVSSLIVAIPVTISIILGLTEWRGNSVLNDPRCILDLWDGIRAMKSSMFSDFILLLILLMLSFFFMPITLTPQTWILIIPFASIFIGGALGLLASFVHLLILGISYRDFVYLNCIQRQLIDRIAQRAPEVLKQGAQHPTGQGRGT
jgi:hypothetical protein